MLFLAKRQLLARKKQTLLILVGILLGSAAYVIISGMMLGFQSYVSDQLINNDANIRVSARQEIINPNSMQREFFGQQSFVNWLIAPSGRRDDERIQNPQEWYHRLRQNKHVVAFAPQLTIQALMSNGQLSNAATLIGTEPQAQLKVTNLGNYLLTGSFNQLKSGGNRLVIGDGLLAKVGGRMGGNVLISVGNNSPQLFKIAGIFHVGIQTIDDTIAYGNLADIQKINRTPSQISTIAIKIDDIKLAATLASEWAKMTRDQVQSWDQLNSNVMAVFRTQTAIRYFMTLSILLVAAFGIYNVLSVLINQKKKEIAILRAMGYEPKEIRQLFLYQGLIVGLMGGLIGLMLGFLACRYMATIPMFRDSTGKINYLRISYDVSIYGYGLLLALLSSLIASVLPANHASKMTPIDIIRESGT
ncbi:MAG: ABC transporter permease [Legionellales bacterium]|nr:ABC transporter permease [Legionellales bacterium]